MTLPISLCYIQPTNHGLTTCQKISLGFDLVTSCALTALGILCIIQLGAGYHVWSGLNAFSTLQGFASYGGILVIGTAWFVSSIITVIYLRRKAVHLVDEENLNIFREAESNKKEISDLLATINAADLPDPFEDDLETTKKKVHGMITQCESMYLKVSQKPFEAKQKESLAVFLENEIQLEDWNYTQQRKLLQASTGYYNTFRHTIESIGEQKRTDLVRKMIKNHPKLFSDREPYFESDWIVFPVLETYKSSSYKEPVLNSEISSTWEKAVKCLEEGETTSSTSCLRWVKVVKDFRVTFPNGEIWSLTTFVRNELADQFKIHLMFKPEFICMGIEKLLEALENDETLRASIINFKILKDMEVRKDPNGKVVPVVVIYTRYNKFYAQTALEGLLSFFTAYNDWGSGQCPRYNADLGNPLVYYAQGDSWQKAKLEKEKPEIFQQLYDPDGAHYNAKFGNFKLKPKQ